MRQYSGKKTFLGIGLGAVQTGLMLYEAFKSNNFERYVIFEVNQNIVNSVRNSGNKIIVNTATRNGIFKTIITNIEIYNPGNPNDYQAISSAIGHADEMATALPSVDFYDAGKNSIARLLAENLNPNKPQVVYTAENNNYAAEILHEKIKNYTDDINLKQFKTINTVIGKMGGVIFDRGTVEELGLDWMTPHSKTAVLVEEFNNIIISKIELSNFKRGIEVFQEKEDLLPFEEAKLFGHNAVHSMLGFFASLRGYTFMSEIRNDPQLYQYGTDAFVKESGAFLLKKYKNIDDSLFTKKGFNFYGADLLERMTNPYLRDEVQRICRDPLRKLAYDDRIFGTIREALKENIYPKIFAKAVLGGICYLINNKVDIGYSYPDAFQDLGTENVKSILRLIWKDKTDDGKEEECLNIVCSELDEFLNEFITINKN
jgi:mannitol-1-phosphate 5-dehydrogenase